MKLDLPYQSFAEYCKAHNVSEEGLLHARKEWVVIYASAYRKQYAKKQLNCILNSKDYQYIVKQAERFNMKSTAYLRHLIKQDQKQTNLRPEVLIDIEVKVLETLEILSEKLSPSETLKGRLWKAGQLLNDILNLLS